MKYTLNDLKKSIEDAQNARRAVVLELDKIGTEIMKNEDEMEKFALNADTQSYEKLYIRNQALKAQQTAKINTLNAVKAKITDEDIKSSWADYADEYNHSAEKELAEYVRLKKQLFHQFLKIIRNQNTALLTLVEYARLLHLNFEEAKHNLKPLRLINTMHSPRRFESLETQFFDDVAHYEPIRKNGYDFGSTDGIIEQIMYGRTCTDNTSIFDDVEKQLQQD